MDKKPKKKSEKMLITKKEHDEWHRKNKGYEGKNSREHELCHKEIGITVRK